jgi:hypothetical protein
MHLQALQKIHRWAWGVAGCSLHQFTSFEVFVSLDVFYCESFEVIIHSTDHAQILLEGRLPGNTLFFYLTRYNYRIRVKDASLDPNGPQVAEPQQYDLIFCYVISALINIVVELNPCCVAQLDSRR